MTIFFMEPSAFDFTNTLFVIIEVKSHRMTAY